MKYSDLSKVAIRARRRRRRGRDEYVVNSEFYLIHECLVCHEDIAIQISGRYTDRFHEECLERYKSGEDSYIKLRYGHDDP